jgi:uncharacterized protein
MTTKDGAHPGRALVTGASSGIGEELARVFAQNGHDVVLVARSQAKLEALAADLSNRYGVRADVLAVDLGDPGGPGRTDELLRERALDIHVLVNNAGVGLHGPFGENEPQAQLRLLQLNVVSLTHLTRLLLPAMTARRSGAILNVASTAAFVPGPLMAVYYASKAYVLSLSVALENELAGTGVTVTTLCPGPTRTNFSEVAGVSRTRLFRAGGVMEPADVARAGYEGVQGGKSIVVPGLRNRLIAGSSALAPRSVTARIARALQEPAHRA